MQQLKQGTRVYLDSSLFIYFIQNDPRYAPVVAILFNAIMEGTVSGISSYLSLLEVLVKPIQENEIALMTEYRDCMLNNAFLTLFPLDEDVAEEAAKLRAQYNKQTCNFELKTPDAIQIATAIVHHADVVYTNDKPWKQIRDIRVICLEEELQPVLH